jgi:hypothetical protein
MCQYVLKHYKNEGDDFLRCIINGNERWFHYYNPESKHQSVEWKHQFKMQTNSEKSDVHTVFWDSQGPVLEHYQ